MVSVENVGNVRILEDHLYIRLLSSHVSHLTCYIECAYTMTYNKSDISDKSDKKF
jgi:hypothetical protein